MKKAFIFESGERSQSFSFVFFQRYEQKETGELVLYFADGGFLRKDDRLSR